MKVNTNTAVGVNTYLVVQVIEGQSMMILSAYSISSCRHARHLPAQRGTPPDPRDDRRSCPQCYAMGFEVGVFGRALCVCVRGKSRASLMFVPEECQGGDGGVQPGIRKLFIGERADGYEAR